MLKEFPVLYKKTSTGAIQFWEIRVEVVGQGFKMYPEIGTSYGQVGTLSPQYTFDLIKEGKNLGKKNATTAWDQAVLEAQARWEKQKKKGYVESIKAAEKGKTDKLIKGGILPMLAHKFSDHGHKIKYPAYVQPKLDGIRCIAIVKDGSCTLWTRTRKQITSMPHIVAELEKMCHGRDYTLDGELYNHEYHNNFETIVSAVRKETPEDGHLNVQYHIYDVVEDGTFQERFNTLHGFFHGYCKKFAWPDYIKQVSTGLVHNDDNTAEWLICFRKQGYEGAIIRNKDGKYVNKRSYDLQKVKKFDDDEFEITGIEEGRGKLRGHVGAFVCRTKDGKNFLAKMSGDTFSLKDYFEDHSLWKGKRLTVKYQGLTGAERVPRFPVGIAIRDYE